MTPFRSALRSSSIALSLASALGCEIDMKLGDLDDPSTTTSTGDGMDASSGSPPAASSTSGVAEGTSGVPEGTSGIAESTSGTTSDSGDTEEYVCDPAPEFLGFYVDFDEVEGFPEVWEIAVDADCVIQGIVDDGLLRTYAIECDEDGVAVPHELEVRREPGPIVLPLAVGTPIHLQAARNYTIDSGHYLYVVIRDPAGELVFGWYSGGDVDDELGVDVDTWFAPLEYALAFGDCEPEPYEAPGTVFIIDPCPTVDTRLAVDFQLGDEGIHLVDRTSGQLGSFSLFVNGARHFDPMEADQKDVGCPLESNWFGFVIYREE